MESSQYQTISKSILSRLAKWRALSTNYGPYHMYDKRYVEGSSRS